MSKDFVPTLLGDLRADHDRLLTQSELCALLGKSPAWAERARWDKSGPAFLKVGRSVAYRAGDVLEWIEATRVESQAA
jgi:predicted DNA-binding transcriptional regulator AlpA